MNPTHGDSEDFQLYPETQNSQSFQNSSAFSMDPYFANNEELAAFEAELESADPNGMLPYPMKSSGSSGGSSYNNSTFESSVPELIEPVGMEGSPTARSESNSSSFNAEMDGYNALDQQNLGMPYPSYMNGMNSMPLMNERSVGLDAMHPFSCDPALPVPEPLLYNTCQFDEGVYDMDAVLRGGFTAV